MIQDKIFLDEKDPTGLSYNTPFTVYGSYQGRLWSKTPSGSIQYYSQNSDLSAYATTGSNQFNGSQTITGSLTVTGGISGSSAESASYALNADKIDNLDSTQLVLTSSFNSYTSSASSSVGSLSSSVATTTSGLGERITTVEGNYATTGSNIFLGSQVITGSICTNGNIVTTGQIVAQTINVQQVTSSIVYSSGSNIFGNSVTNTQQFTGSLQVSGSSHYLLGSVGIGTTSLVSDALLPLQINAGVSGQAYFASNNNGGYGLLMGYDNTNGYARIRNVSNTALTFETNNSEKVRLDCSGNIGIGVTPCAWANPTAGKVIQIGNRASLFSYNNNTLDLSTNFYFDGTDYRYIQSAPATLLRGDSSDGSFVFYNAISGTAGGVVSLNERMRITNAGAVTFCCSGTFGSTLSATTGYFSGNVVIDNTSLNNPKFLQFDANISSGANASLGDIRWYNKQWDASIKAQIVALTDTDITNGRLSFRTGTDGVNATERLRISSTGVSCFQNTVCAPIATLSSYVQTPGLYGKSYPQTSTSGNVSIVDTGIYNSVNYSTGVIWLVSYGGNPLAAGSNYFANYLGALSVTTGYIGGSVKQYIQYSPISQFDSSGVGALSLTAVFWDGTTELTTIPNGSTAYQIRLKIGTYNPVGAGQYVYLLKMGQ